MSCALLLHAFLMLFIFLHAKTWNPYGVALETDERIKYSREELFELQLSPLADPSLCHPDKLPQILRRD